MKRMVASHKETMNTQFLCVAGFGFRHLTSIVFIITLSSACHDSDSASSDGDLLVAVGGDNSVQAVMPTGGMVPIGDDLGMDDVPQLIEGDAGLTADASAGPDAMP